MVGAGLGPVVAALWKELGMAPPVERIESAFDFELEEVPMALALAENGETVVLRAQLGFLENDAHEAGDQLQRVLRLSLGLTAMNAAVLDASRAEELLELGHEGRVPIYAVATAQVSKPGSIVSAVESVLEWYSVTGTLLIQEVGEVEERTAKPAARSQALDADVIIFQP